MCRSQSPQLRSGAVNPVTRPPKKRQIAPTSAGLILQVMPLSVLALVTQLVAALLILSGSRKMASVPGGVLVRDSNLRIPVAMWF